MLIYLIARGYPSKKDPVWGCFEKDQAEAFTQMGHKVIILAVDTRFRLLRLPLKIQHIEENGLSVYNIISIPHAFLFFLSERTKNMLSRILLHIVYKRAERIHGRPDILYSHYLYNTQCAIYLKNRYKIPLVAIEHWSHLGKNPIPKDILEMARETYPEVDQLISVSTALRKNIMQQIGIDSQVVPNMLSKDFFREIDDVHNDTTKIITIGRLVDGKRFDMLIQALSQVRTPYELNIIGDGPIKNKLEELIQQLSLTENIKLLGHKNKEELVKILQQSDFFVLASQSETFGVSYIEAMACGLPIIATDCGGPTDFVNKQNGILIPTNDIIALTNALEYIIANISKYKRTEIAKDCQNRFSPEIIAKRLISIFEDVIKH